MGFSSPANSEILQIREKLFLSHFIMQDHPEIPGKDDFSPLNFPAGFSKAQTQKDPPSQQSLSDLLTLPETKDLIPSGM